jgi:hypothetical protein
MSWGASCDDVRSQEQKFFGSFFQKRTYFSLMVPFRPPYAPDDAALAAHFLAGATLSPAREARIDAEGRRLVNAIRDSASGIGGIEALLHPRGPGADGAGRRPAARA